MADIRAFRGFRYTPAAGPIGTLAAPPYDVIGEEQRERLAARNPRNIVHLILPRGGSERYRLAGERLESFCRDGALAQEKDPALYLYRQSFQGPDGRSQVRTGFIGIVRLDATATIVRHHERTLARPLEDRLRLMRATGAQLSPIFLLYSDPEGKALRMLEPRAAAERHRPRPSAALGLGRRATELAPGGILEFNDDEGVRHWMQPISDETATQEARSVLADLPLVIADGHHRYSAALEYRDRLQRAFGDDDPELPENFMLACFVRIEDPGLVMLPTHRIVPAEVEGPSPESLLASLSRRFEIRSLEVPPGSYPREEVPSLQAERSPRVVIGARFADDPRLHVLRLRDDVAQSADIALPELLRGVDVAVLHGLILEPEFGIDDEAAQRGGRLLYARDPSEATAQVTSGQARAAFFLRPLPTSDLLEVTAHGLRLPQKSTYFAPKLASGLVLRLLRA